MTEITFVDDVTVELIDYMGGDDSVIRAAQVSVIGRNDGDEAKDPYRFINYLMRSRHGSPFEAGAMQFYVEAPIYVAREFMRHRMASYNEVSGRYKKLAPRFFMYPEGRGVVNEGNGAVPKMVPGSLGQDKLVRRALEDVYRTSWAHYESMTDQGIATEVARAVLPVGLMTEFYVTMNLRSLMNFINLRTSDTGASRPQAEIEMVAKKIEDAFARAFPVVYATFNDNGRVAP